MFGNLGSMEIIFLALVFIIIFGGKKLPEIGKFLGEGLQEFKKATQNVTPTNDKKVISSSDTQEKK